MPNYHELLSLLTAMDSAIDSYERSPNKESSLSIRKILLRMDRIGPLVRIELIEADKAGY